MDSASPTKMCAIAHDIIPILKFLKKCIFIQCKCRHAMQSSEIYFVTVKLLGIVTDGMPFVIGCTNRAMPPLDKHMHLLIF